MRDVLIQKITRDKQITVAEIASQSDIEKAVELGVDLAVLYHTTYLGIAKIGGILPFGNANDIVIKMIDDVKPKESPIPIIVGLCGTEPFRIRDMVVQHLLDVGVVGVQNFPTVGIIDGIYRDNLESVKQGYEKECTLIKKGHEVGLISFPFVFNVTEALAMVKSGADILVCHPGAMADSKGFNMTSGTFENHWEHYENIGREAKEKCPNIKILVYTENQHNIDRMKKNLSGSKAIDGIYHSISLNRS